jgi:hypothetical protein
MDPKGDKKVTKIGPWICNICETTYANEKNYKKHVLTAKHTKRVTNGDIFGDNKIWKCECGKSYQFRQGISRHKKKCKFMDPKKNDWILQVLEQNQKLILDNKEFKEKLLELSSKPTIVNKVKHVQNKQFNLNIFLNETCKHAMNMSDFINSLVICNEDFENMGKLGYIQGISNILIRGLKGLDQTERPCHCTDKKREILYIKQNNVWNKEQVMDIMKQVILDVSYKNVKKIPFWKAEHPHCEDTSTQKYLEYIAILNQIMTGIHPDKETDLHKIFRNVAHSVILDKSHGL